MDAYIRNDEQAVLCADCGAETRDPSWIPTEDAISCLPVCRSCGKFVPAELTPIGRERVARLAPKWNGRVRYETDYQAVSYHLAYSELAVRIPHQARLVCDPEIVQKSGIVIEDDAGNQWTAEAIDGRLWWRLTALHD